MHPILLEWGSVVIPSWHFMYAMGAVAAFLLVSRLNKRLPHPIDDRQISNLFIICYLAGYIGARMLSIIVEQPELHSFQGIFEGLFSLGPMTFYGGAIAAFLAGCIYSRWAKFNLRDVIDVSLPAGLLALAIGRIGCFLNGDDFGSVVTTNGTSPWWAVTFPNLKDGLPRYPVQLYETIAVGTAVIILVKMFATFRTKVAPGIIGYLCIVAYANIRFVLEFYRGDFRGNPFGNWMSTSQLISIAILIVCAASASIFLNKKNS